MKNQIINGEIINLIPEEILNKKIQSGAIFYQNYKKNEVIHFEDDLCDQVEIIINGEVAVERIGISGDLMTANIFTINQIIGANLIFSSYNHYPMTVTALKQTRVLIIKKAILFSLCKDYPEFLLGFVQIISDLSVQIGTKMKNRVSRTIRDSIITYLNKQYESQNSTTIKMDMKKKSLAEQFGISRTSLSRELKKMKDDNLIDYDLNSITILDLSLLK